jgi:hypothetical protein
LAIKEGKGKMIFEGVYFDPESLIRGDTNPTEEFKIPQQQIVIVRRCWTGLGQANKAEEGRRM